MTNFRKDQLIFLLFRIGIFLTFFGHEYEAFNVNKIWIHYLEDIGFSKEQASTVFTCNWVNRYNSGSYYINKTN